MCVHGSYDVYAEKVTGLGLCCNHESLFQVHSNAEDISDVKVDKVVFSLLLAYHANFEVLS